MQTRRISTALAFSALVFPSLAFGAAYDAPNIQVVLTGAGKAVVSITAGQSGAPAGFTFLWMKQSEFVANGNQFYSSPNLVQGEGVFTGEPTVNTFRGAVVDFVLTENQTILVEIGDLFDETGVTVTAPTEELAPQETYVFGAQANGDANGTRSSLSNVVTGTTIGANCTLTQGFWKNHQTLWPVSGLWLGSVFYTNQQLLDILHESVHGNGLSSLAHQLIATKLNIAGGADPTSIDLTVMQAESLIGGLVIPPVGSGYLEPSWTSPFTQALDDYNNGVYGPGHCGTTSVEEVSWGRVKAGYR